MSKASDIPIPGAPKFYCATTSDEMTLRISGRGVRWGEVTLTATQHRALVRWLQHDEDAINRLVAEARAEHEATYRARVAKWEALPTRITNTRPLYREFNEAGVRLFLSTGTDRNLSRYAEVHAMRVLAFLARFLEPGQDPVQLVAQLCSDAGYDVPELCEFESDEAEE